jgi:hypothetical protein
MPEPAAPPTPPTIPAPSASGLAACLLVLVGEAQSLSRPFAAHLIAAAAADLLEADKPSPTGTTPTGTTPTQAAR